MTISKQEFDKRINKSLIGHYEALNKELSCSEDLQDKNLIAEHKQNIKKVKAMLKLTPSEYFKSRREG